MHAEHENRRIRQHFENPFCRRQAAYTRQSAVHDSDPRPQLLGELDCFLAITGLAYDYDVGLILQHATKSASHQGVVVNQQD